MQLEQSIGFRKAVNMFQEDDNLPLPKELIGVELEVEGVRGVRPDTPHLWREVQDDSLRNYGREYIFNEPLYGTGITDALMDMAMWMDRVQPETTYRTSVHVHINVSDMEVDEFLTMLVLYLIFERTLVRYHDGGSREDNIFCIPHYKAPETISRLMWIYKELESNELTPEILRDSLHNFEKYNALNVGAVMTHGSLEFRHMPGTIDMGQVLEWIKIIQHLKRAATDGSVSYMELIESASGSTSSLLEQVFQDTADVLRYPDMTNDIMAGARLAQRIIKGSALYDLTTKESGRRLNRATSDKISAIKSQLTGKDEDVVVNEDNIPPPHEINELPIDWFTTSTPTDSGGTLWSTASTAPDVPEDREPSNYELEQIAAFFDSLERNNTRGTE